MAEEWKPGDVALCVDASRSSAGDKFPQLTEGEKYTVMSLAPDKIVPGFAVYTKSAGFCLVLLESKHPSNYTGAWNAGRFVKQPPLVEEDETETVEEYRLVNAVELTAPPPPQGEG